MSNSTEATLAAIEALLIKELANPRNALEAAYKLGKLDGMIEISVDELAKKGVQMIRIRGVAYRDEDDAYDAWRQEQVDAEQEAQAKRNASGISPEELSLQDAFLYGQRLGAAGHGREMCLVYDPSTPEYAECERGRLNAIGARLGHPQRKTA